MSVVALDLMAWRSLRLVSLGLTRRLDLTVEGVEHVPSRGPVIIAARHVHHLYDGCALLATIARPVHVLAGLDWTRAPAARRLMERACAIARWPVVLRQDRLASAAPSAFEPREAVGYLRRAMRQVDALLTAGHVVAIFPEAYPAVEPGDRLTRGLDSLLPLRPGLAAIVARHERRAAGRVPIIPAGLSYERGERWRVDLRFGAPLTRVDAPDDAALLQTLDHQLRRLSGLPLSARSALHEGMS